MQSQIPLCADEPEGGGRWQTGRFAFVTLWSERATSDRVLEWLATAEIPRHSVLYWVDNSAGRVTARLREEWEARLCRRFSRLVWVESGEPYRMASGEDLLHIGRHRHVAHLYNQVFPRIFEEWVVILEDDIEPPRDAVRGLLSVLEADERVAMAAGVYRDRVAPAKICAARAKGVWRDVPQFDGMPREPFDVGMAGGGFALVANRALQQALPVRCEKKDRGLLGWDGNLGHDLTSLGFRLMVHPGVRCAHHCAEVAAYEAARKFGGKNG